MSVLEVVTILSHSIATLHADTRDSVVSVFPISKVAIQVILLESSIITQLFCTIFQVIESKRATALSVEDAAHSVFVVLRFVKFVFT